MLWVLFIRPRLHRLYEWTEFSFFVSRWYDELIIRFKRGIARSYTSKHTKYSLCCGLVVLSTITWKMKTRLVWNTVVDTTYSQKSYSQNIITQIWRELFFVEKIIQRRSSKCVGRVLGVNIVTTSRGKFCIKCEREVNTVTLTSIQPSTTSSLEVVTVYRMIPRARRGMGERGGIFRLP